METTVGTLEAKRPANPLVRLVRGVRATGTQPQPSRRYNPLFPVCGATFAILTYVIGTWIYEWENARATVYHGPVAPWTLLWNAATYHAFSFFPWIVGTTVLAIMLGYVFDRETRLVTRLEALAVTDGLTLVYNHRYLVQTLSREVSRVGRRTQHGFSVLLLDLDDFKRYNDTHGHLAGDDVLRLTAQTLKSVVRDTDVVARYGGEEFVVIAVGANEAGARDLAEKLRQRVRETLPVTASIGVATCGPNGSTADDLIAAADAAMYRAKAEGKDRICFA